MKLKWIMVCLISFGLGCSDVEGKNGAAEYYKKAWNMMSENADSAKILVVKSIEIALNEENTKQLATSYHLLGYIQEKENDFSLALKNYYKSLSYYRVLGEQKLISDILMNIGVIFFECHAYDKSLELYSEAIHIKQQIQDTLLLIKLYQNVGQTFRYQSKYDSAAEFGEVAIRLLQGFDPDYTDHREYASKLFNDVGISQKENGQMDEALNSFEKSLSLAKGTPEEKERTAKALNNIGEVYFKRGDITLAKNFYQKAFNLMNEINLNHWSLWRVYNNLGLVYMSEKDYDSAIHHFKTVTEKHESAKTNMDDLELARSYQHLVEAYQLLENKDAVIDNLITIANRNKKLVETCIEYDNLYRQLIAQRTLQEINEREDIIAQVKRQKGYISLGAGSVISFLIGLALYRKRIREKEKAEIIREIERMV